MAAGGLLAIGVEEAYLRRRAKRAGAKDLEAPRTAPTSAPFASPSAMAREWHLRLHQLYEHLATKRSSVGVVRVSNLPRWLCEEEAVRLRSDHLSKRRHI